MPDLKLGLIGDNISRSKAPLLHQSNAGFKFEAAYRELYRVFGGESTVLRLLQDGRVDVAKALLLAIQTCAGMENATRV